MIGQICNFISIVDKFQTIYVTCALINKLTVIVFYGDAILNSTVLRFFIFENYTVAYYIIYIL